MCPQSWPRLLGPRRERRSLDLRYDFARYHFSHKLHSLIQCVKRLWAYLKEKELQDPENKQWFTPDETMAPIFGDEKIKCFSMSKYLKEHLTNPDK